MKGVSQKAVVDYKLSLSNTFRPGKQSVREARPKTEQKLSKKQNIKQNHMEVKEKNRSEASSLTIANRAW